MIRYRLHVCQSHFIFVALRRDTPRNIRNIIIVFHRFLGYTNRSPWVECNLFTFGYVVLPSTELLRVDFADYVILTIKVAISSKKHETLAQCRFNVGPAS